MCLGIFWSVEEWLEMASNETVMLILRSSPNLVDILGDTYFDFITFIFWNLLLPDSQIFKPLDSKIDGFLDFQISRLKAVSQRYSEHGSGPQNC